MACLNVQHDCHHGQCETVQDVLPPAALREGHAVTMNISHSQPNHYVLNVCSHHAARYHRIISSLCFPQPSNEEVQSVVTPSVDKWVAEEQRKKTRKSKGKGKETESLNPPRG